MSALDLSYPPEWMADGSCAQTGVGAADLWHPAKGEWSREAKAVCMRCPVRSECLEYALADRDLSGIWGGTSERERTQMRRDAS